MGTRVGSEAERAALRRLESLVLRELNVKTITLLDVNTRFVSYVIRPNLPVVGRILGKDTPRLKTALEAMHGYEIVDNIHRGLPTTVEIAGNRVELEPSAFLVSVNSPEGFSAIERDGLLLALNTNLAPELVAEGRVRELIRHIQEARKNAGFDVSDRIRLTIDAPPELSGAIATHCDYLADETLATEVVMAARPEMLQRYVEGFGFVEFNNDEQALAGIAGMKGRDVNGQVSVGVKQQGQFSGIASTDSSASTTSGKSGIG